MNRGLDAVAATNAVKATKLYQAIDRSGFYSNKVRFDARSRMNIPFMLADADLSDCFILEAERMDCSTCGDTGPLVECEQAFIMLCLNRESIAWFRS